MTKKSILLLAAILVCGAIQAEDNSYRDAHGHITGYSTEHGNQTTYRDSTGRITGYSTKSGNT